MAFILIAFTSWFLGYLPLLMVPLDPLLIPLLNMESPEGAKANLIAYKVYGLQNIVGEKVS